MKSVKDVRPDGFTLAGYDPPGLGSLGSMTCGSCGLGELESRENGWGTGDRFSASTLAPKSSLELPSKYPTTDQKTNSSVNSVPSLLTSTGVTKVKASVSKIKTEIKKNNLAVKSLENKLTLIGQQAKTANAIDQAKLQTEAKAVGREIVMLKATNEKAAWVGGGLTTALVLRDRAKAGKTDQEKKEYLGLAAAAIAGTRDFANKQLDLQFPGELSTGTAKTTTAGSGIVKDYGILNNKLRIPGFSRPQSNLKLPVSTVAVPRESEIVDIQLQSGDIESSFASGGTGLGGFFDWVADTASSVGNAVVGIASQIGSTAGSMIGAAAGNEELGKVIGNLVQGAASGIQGKTGSSQQQNELVQQLANDPALDQAYQNNNPATNYLPFYVAGGIAAVGIIGALVIPRLRRG